MKEKTVRKKNHLYFIPDGISSGWRTGGPKFSTFMVKRWGLRCHFGAVGRAGWRVSNAQGESLHKVMALGGRMTSGM